MVLDASRGILKMWFLRLRCDVGKFEENVFNDVTVEQT